MSSSSGLASMATPFTVTVTVVLAGASCSVSATWTPPLFDVEEVLVAEAVHRRDDRRDRRRAERADRRLLRRPCETGRDVVADVEQQLEVVLATGARLDAVHDLLEPRRALSARGALAAGLVGEEAHEVPRRADRAGRVVHDHESGAEHGPGLLHLVDVELHVEVLLEQPRERRADEERLEVVAVAEAAP